LVLAIAATASRASRAAGAAAAASASRASGNRVRNRNRGAIRDQQAIATIATTAGYAAAA
jgi:hypothetical protein